MVLQSILQGDASKFFAACELTSTYEHGIELELISTGETHVCYFTCVHTASGSLRQESKHLTVTYDADTS